MSFDLSEKDDRSRSGPCIAYCRSSSCGPCVVNNRIEWFLTGVVSVCAAFLLSVCLGTALLLFLDDDSSLKASAPQPARTAEPSPKALYDDD